MTWAPDIEPQKVEPVPLTPPPLRVLPFISELDQKVKVGGAAGLAALAVMTIAGHFGFNPQPMADWVFGPGIVDVQAYLTYAITIGVAYVVPMAWQDIAKRLNNKVVAHAVVDQTISAPVTLVGIEHEVRNIAPVGGPGTMR